MRFLPEWISSTNTNTNNSSDARGMIAAVRSERALCKAAAEADWSRVDLQHAAFQYEHVWLPYAAAAQAAGRGGADLAQTCPLDVAWIWHAHLLSPRQYREDCIAAVGVVVEPEGIAVPTDSATMLQGNMPPHAHAQHIGRQDEEAAPKSQIKYDVIAAAERQSAMWHSISLPHWDDAGWLNVALVRYCKFLKLVANHPHETVVPTFDIDLVWHAHMTYHAAYVHDTANAISNGGLAKGASTRTTAAGVRKDGFQSSRAVNSSNEQWSTATASVPYPFLNHDDALGSDRSPESTLSNAGAQTGKWWPSITIGNPSLDRHPLIQKYGVHGGMWRGMPAAPLAATISNMDASTMRALHDKCSFLNSSLATESMWRSYMFRPRFSFDGYDVEDYLCSLAAKQSAAEERKATLKIRTGRIRLKNWQDSPGDFPELGQGEMMKVGTAVATGTGSDPATEGVCSQQRTLSETPDLLDQMYGFTSEVDEARYKGIATFSDFVHGTVDPHTGRRRTAASTVANSGAAAATKVRQMGAKVFKTMFGASWLGAFADAEKTPMRSNRKPSGRDTDGDRSQHRRADKESVATRTGPANEASCISTLNIFAKPMDRTAACEASNIFVELRLPSESSKLGSIIPVASAELLAEHSIPLAFLLTPENERFGLACAGESSGIAAERCVMIHDRVAGEPAAVIFAHWAEAKSPAPPGIQKPGFEGNYGELHLRVFLPEPDCARTHDFTHWRMISGRLYGPQSEKTIAKAGNKQLCKRRQFLWQLQDAIFQNKEPSNNVTHPSLAVSSLSAPVRIVYDLAVASLHAALEPAAIFKWVEGPPMSNASDSKAKVAPPAPTTSAVSAVSALRLLFRSNWFAEEAMACRRGHGKNKMPCWFMLRKRQYIFADTFYPCIFLSSASWSARCTVIQLTKNFLCATFPSTDQQSKLWAALHTLPVPSRLHTGA